MDISELAILLCDENSLLWITIKFAIIFLFLVLKFYFEVFLDAEISIIRSAYFHGSNRRINTMLQ